jgi:hypothetical protein
MGRAGGYGRGFGWRRFGAPSGAEYTPAYGPDPLDSTEEINMLRAEADSLNNALADINQRLAELERQSAE